MFARFLLAAIWLSILLSVAIAILWVRSYFYGDEVHFSLQQNTGVEGVSFEGDLEINCQTNIPGGSLRTWGWGSRPIAQLRFMPRHQDIFGSIFSFRWRDRSFPLTNNPAGPKFHIRAFTIPLWTPFLLSATLPAWIYFRGHRKERWRFRKDIRWINPRLHSRVARFALFSAAGAFGGVLVSWLEIKFNLWRTDWEGILAFIILVPTVCLLVFRTRRRIPFHKALLWMTLELAGTVCFYSFATERTFHYLGGYVFGPDDAPQIDVLLFFASFLCSAILLFFFQLKPEPVKPGPYCPQCGYCLIGTPRQICPECGGPFTHDELGVTPEALIPSAAPQLTTGSDIRPYPY